MSLPASTAGQLIRSLPAFGDVSDFGIGSAERSIIDVVYALFVTPGNFSKNRKRFRDKRPGAMPKGSQNFAFSTLVPAALPPSSLLTLPSDFAILVTRAARLSRAGIELTSRGINWYRQPIRLRLNTPAPAYAHNIDVHPPESHTCRNVAVRSFVLSLLYVRRFSTILHNAPRR